MGRSCGNQANYKGEDPMDRMKTVVVNGVPYRMRGDMKLPNWRKGASGTSDWGRDHDPFRKGHRDYLTTPESCVQKRQRVGDGCPRNARTPVIEPYTVIEEQIDLFRIAA